MERNVFGKMRLFLRNQDGRIHLTKLRRLHQCNNNRSNRVVKKCQHHTGAPIPLYLLHIVGVVVTGTLLTIYHCVILTIRMGACL
jgi:hypothetical protein